MVTLTSGRQQLTQKYALLCSFLFGENVDYNFSLDNGWCKAEMCFKALNLLLIQKLKKLYVGYIAQNFATNI